MDSDSSESKELSRIEYYDVSPDEIDNLITALKALNEVADTFFRVLEHLNEVQGVEAKASFDCLRETMQLYLQQVPKEGKGARWIARNFEQIDGDVLRKYSKNQDKIYHFACLSDQHMSITHRDEFPWPLDIDFFVTSRLEYKNFRRYALVYGLAFSKCKIKLSYIKNAPDQENELYYLLKVLNATPKPYILDTPNAAKKNDSYITVEEALYREFSQYDLMKYRLCGYRFLLETVIEGKSVYKDDFLLKLYLTILLEHRARKEFSGKTYVKNMVRNYLAEQMDELTFDFPFMNRSEKIDAINMAEDYLEKKAVLHGKFTSIKNKDIDYMLKRENFLSVPSSKAANEAFSEVFKNSTQAEVEHTLSDENLNQDKYRRSYNSLCDKCADKDICLEIFRTSRK